MRVEQRDRYSVGECVCFVCVCGRERKRHNPYRKGAIAAYCTDVELVKIHLYSEHITWKDVHARDSPWNVSIIFRRDPFTMPHNLVLEARRELLAKKPKNAWDARDGKSKISGRKNSELGCSWYCSILLQAWYITLCAQNIYHVHIILSESLKYG